MRGRLKIVLLPLFTLSPALFGQADPPTPQPGDVIPPRPEAPEPQPLPAYQDEYLTGDWAGLRTKLAQRGLSFEALATADLSKNFHGGLETEGEIFRYLIDFNISLDTQRLGAWDGGLFFLNFQHHDGDFAADDIGDFQWISSIDAPPFTQISELWYQQTLLDEKLRLRAGKIDANLEFAYALHAENFINAGFWALPTSLVMPTYPNPAGGAEVFAYPADWLQAGFGVFDGSLQEGNRTGRRGISTFWNDPSDLYLIGEIGLNWSLAQKDGRLLLGSWHHTGTFQRFSGGTENGDTGVYAILDQTLYRENPGQEDDEQGLGFFLQYDYGDEHVNDIGHHVGTGLVWTGLIPGRDEDILGAGLSYVHFTKHAGYTDDFETAYELFYKIQLHPAFSITADLQYIVNPGGADLDDALVGTLRFEAAF